ncbi:MAG TPA: hypothetical protein PKI49_16400, partial [Pseudomonadota bacterium]|nr:hypothetical protein [Pseudomonadota bacterium]
MQQILKHGGHAPRRMGMSHREASWIWLWSWLIMVGTAATPLRAHADEPVAPSPKSAEPSAEPSADASADSESEPPPAGYSTDGGKLRPKDAVPFAGVVREKGSRDPLANVRVTITPWKELPPDPSAKPGKKT